MKQKLVWQCLLFLAAALSLHAQVTLNPLPARAIGQPNLNLLTVNPNYVEGRELYQPLSIAVDTNASPWVVYVADTLNNRVLGWIGATSASNDTQASFVIGQKDLYSTFPQGPEPIRQKSYGAQLAGGLWFPTGLAVDGSGNLFVADSGNNRILRFPKPYSTPPGQVNLPDLVIGQTDTSTGTPNTGGISAKTLSLSPNTNISSGLTQYRSTLYFDPAGNLYCTDAANQRVLRYPASSVGATAVNGPAADLVLGQSDFNISPPKSPTSQTDFLRSLYSPTGLSMDSKGRLFVSDVGDRVVVYEPPFNKGQYAARYIGDGSQQHQFSTPPSPSSLLSPGGVVVVDDAIYVVDTGNNRILRFEPYDTWGTTLIQATDVIGQDGFTQNPANRGGVIPATDKVTLYQPVQAVVAGNELFVDDSSNHRMLVVPKPAAGSGATMVPRRVLGQHGLDTNGPNLVDGRGFFLGNGGGVVVDTNSNPPHLYVSDTVNNRILGYLDARNLRPGASADLIIGQFNQGTNQTDAYRWLINCPTGNSTTPSNQSLNRPAGLAVDASGNLYVADSGNGRVLRFPKPFNQPLTQAPAADLVLGQKDFNTSSNIFNVSIGPDPSPSTMAAPYGLALSTAGHLFVSDVYHNRVLLFEQPFQNSQSAASVQGQTDFYSKTAGAVVNQMNGPHHISTDTSDRLYVADTYNNRVQVFINALTAAPGATPTILPPPVGFTTPLAVFVNANPGQAGEIWVSGVYTNVYPNTPAVWRFPEYLRYVSDPVDNPPVIPLVAGELALALALDGSGYPVVAYSTNRVAFYFQGFRAVSAANYIPGVAPGLISTLWPLDENKATGLCSDKFTTQTMVFDQVSYPPVTTTLADLQVLVTVNGTPTPAPLHFVSPCQINFWMPNDPSLSSGSVEIQVVKKSTSQIIAVGCDAVQPQGSATWFCRGTGPALTNLAAPGLFTADTTGVGQVKALNDDNSVNSPSNPIARGKVIQLFGTGAGFIQGAPADGSPAPASGLINTSQHPRVFIGTDWVPDANVQYSGLTPTLVGVWQINVLIPSSVAPSSVTGPTPVLLEYNGVLSSDANTGYGHTTIAVK